MDNSANTNETNNATNTVDTNASTGNTVANASTEGAGKSNNELFEKLDSILDKRFDGLTKSILKSSGVSDEDVSELVKEYKAQKTSKQQSADDKYKALEEENKTLKSQITKTNLNKTANELADELKIDKKYMKQVMKLADLDGVVENNEINKDKLNSALSKVIEDCDLFKVVEKSTETENKNFKTIGAQKQENKKDESDDAMIRKIMGLTEKKEQFIK